MTTDKLREVQGVKMAHDFKAVLDDVKFCIKTISNPRIEAKDNCIWSSGTHERPTITQEKLETILYALKLADAVTGDMSDDMAELIAVECNCCGGIAETLYSKIKKQLLKEIEQEG